jgi:predicted alpha/beta hydrolase
VIESETIRITAEDGYVLGGTLLRAANSRRVVIVHGATAVPHLFYRRFAEFLQSRGLSVLLYDFRGVAASAPKSLKGFAAKCSDWGMLDMPAAVAWVQKNLSPERIYFVGHSAGGQQAGLLEDSSMVDAMLTVCAQSGYWRLQGGREKFNVLLQVGLVIPLLVRVVGYLPWSRLAKAEDLPAGVALQWARWCRHRDYLHHDQSLPLERFRRFSAPVLAYSIDDDHWGTKAAVDALTDSSYPHAERRHIVPAGYEINRLGHMGYFRPGSEPLWVEAVDWLIQH